MTDERLERAVIAWVQLKWPTFGERGGYHADQWSEIERAVLVTEKGAQWYSEETPGEPGDCVIELLDGSGKTVRRIQLGDHEIPLGQFVAEVCELAE